MRLSESQARILAGRELNAFIALSAEPEPESDHFTVGVKDIIDVRGMVTTAGGIFLPYRTAEHDAPVVAAVRAAGGVVAGKTHTHEYAYGITGENPHFGNARNPRDPSRITGGSSSGSAAAVAAGMVDWAIGTDTGGSIRVPAGLCGVVGIKPTLGACDRHGVVPLSPTLDTVGPLAPDVATAARALEILSGQQGLAPVSGAGPEGFRLGVPRGWIFGLDDATAAAFEAASRGLPEVDFIDREQASLAGQVISMWEAARFHQERWDTEPWRFGENVRVVLEAAYRTTESEYREALAVRQRAMAESDHLMRDLDALLVPAAAIVAPPFDTPGVRPRLFQYSRPFNITGQPVVCIPFPVAGLPVGIQVIARSGADATAIQVASALERAWRS